MLCKALGESVGDGLVESVGFIGGFWGMRRVELLWQAQHFLGAHAAVYNLFTLRVQTIWDVTWYVRRISVISG